MAENGYYDPYGGVDGGMMGAMEHYRGTGGFGKRQQTAYSPVVSLDPRRADHSLRFTVAMFARVCQLKWCKRLYNRL